MNMGVLGFIEASKEEIYELSGTEKFEILKTNSFSYLGVVDTQKADTFKRINYFGAEVVKYYGCGYYIFKKDGYCGYLQQIGKTLYLYNHSFKKCGDFVNGISIFKTKEGKYGLFDTINYNEPRLILYDKILKNEKGNILASDKKGKTELLNILGNSILIKNESGRKFYLYKINNVFEKGIIYGELARGKKVIIKYNKKEIENHLKEYEQYKDMYNSFKEYIEINNINVSAYIVEEQKQGISPKKIKCFLNFN